MNIQWQERSRRREKLIGKNQNRLTDCNHLLWIHLTKGKERNKGEERRVKERHTNSPGSEQKPTLVFIMVEAGANTKQIRGAMKSFCECVRARVLVCPEKTVTVDRADIVWADTAGSEGARAGEHI